ncbi:MAG: GNAT family N-acetyltransferase [Ardenticatenaceae bacterium]|nr:GNAT family N-acetyltransferase [Ardenticatenaceae bacterium]
MNIVQCQPARVSLNDSYDIAGLMCSSLAGVDVEFDAMIRTPLRRWWTRHVYLPAYFHFLNEGWKLVCGGQIAAYLYLLFGRQTCHVNDIGVVPAYRRQGLARRLMAFAEERARARSLTAMTLAVTVRNQPAVTLYLSLGYRAAAHHFWSGRRDALLAVPARGQPVRRRELSPAQRIQPFCDLWGRSLATLGLPAAAVVADQARQWWTPVGRAFELWGDEPGPLGYADLVSRNGTSQLRVLPARSDDEVLLVRLVGALAPVVPDDEVQLELGNETADTVVAALLQAHDFQYSTHGRMLMVKAV